MTETATFGSREVPLEDKQALVDDVFRSVARRYDLMNDLMSFGLHRAWKDALVTAVNPPPNGPFALLDVAGGTGDVAMRVLAAGGAGTKATVCDINPEMLAVGRERAEARGWYDELSFTEGNAEALPFADRQFRRGHHRFRHPQCATRRACARRGVSRAADRRPVSVP